MPHNSISPKQLGSARRLRRSLTGAERLLWKHLRAHRFGRAGFRRQSPMGPYIVDFVYHKAKLVIEIDGGQHAEAEQIAADRRRTVWLAARGYRVMRFWNNEVLKNIDGVLDKIEIALRARPPSLTLPRKGGGDSEEFAA